MAGQRRTIVGDRKDEPAPPVIIDAALLERWALAYLERFASSAENLRRVLLRKARRRVGPDQNLSPETRQDIDGLLARYCTTGLIDDAAYAAGRARARLRRGQSLRTIRAALAAKGVGAEDAAAAIGALSETTPDPELAAACAFARRRRLGPYRRDDSGDSDRLRELAAFARAGFSRRAATAVLACADENAIQELLETQS
ncbi:MAG TPA: RecX family transcriptional regulator [Stellaceae bacterium]|jgi:regulatory protein|nr:RecX family transcriptional regulator [Stellaceae bacterium]